MPLAFQNFPRWSMRELITQSSHGFVAGDVLKRSGSLYVKAKADSAANAEVIGIVESSQSTDTFILVYSGRINGLSGLVDGTAYFLSDITAGLLTAMEPATLGFISKPVLVATGTATGIVINMRGMVINSSTDLDLYFNLYDGGSVLGTGVRGDLRVGSACVINRVTLLGDQTGSIVLDIWKAAYGSFPPTVSNSITAAAKPTISSAQKYEDTTLTGWTTAVAAGDVLRFNVDSVSTLTRCAINLKVRKTA